MKVFGQHRVGRVLLERALIVCGLALAAVGTVKLLAPLAYAHQPELLRSPLLLRTGTLHTAGKLEVPRLGLSTLFVDGQEDDALAVAAAHLRETPLPGNIGNSVIAGHRDLVFRGLRHIRPGDLIRISAGHSFNYVVESIRIVSPDDVSVLRASPARLLTLITCYPFYFVGEAPKRFVVQARLVEVSRDRRH